MTPASLSLTAAAWDDALDVIPDAWLARAFKAAQQAHRGTYPLTASEVAAAWDGLLDERQRAATVGSDHQLPAGPVRVCGRCSGIGWVKGGGPGGTTYTMARCPACQGVPSRGPEDYTVPALQLVLQAWCAEHRDGLAFPVRLSYALACKAAGYPPYDLRRLLDSTGEPTLYRALVSLGVPVDPPPAVGTHDPRSLGALLEAI